MLPHAFAYFFPLLVWAKWPRQVGDKYANACGCTQPRAWAYFFPYLSVQCGPESMWKAHILFPIHFWAMWPRNLREKYANACGCMQPRLLMLDFPILDFSFFHKCNICSGTSISPRFKHVCLELVWQTLMHFNDNT